MKHLLKMMDLSTEEIIEILNLADQLKYELKHGIPHDHLKGKTLGMIFRKASTRTRVSFETGMYQLGGNPLYLSASDMQIGRGEPIQDTARVLSRYIDGIMIRTFDQAEVENLAEYGNIPIINGLTDLSHPCQVLADRMSVSVACPENYHPAATTLAFTKKYDCFELTDDPIKAAKDADVIFTDVWASMGQEGEAEIRKKAFKGFQINDEVMAVAKPDAMVQHCLPAHREEEITAKVFEEHANEIFDEAENRLHAQKAVMVLLMGNKD